ncbi:MFS transporter [Niveibacterium sp. 24ML]|uniref:MFS transporter n=1 Tax=Niveibacterium sp. 24ML TaxID=2985512 RepID=UPI00226DC07C|nr:MFS transporter [Niveibacterium sp. 24ML]MCX9154552.1 MFS transporter [Niveibacterium sp. 24ML]
MFAYWMRALAPAGSLWRHRDYMRLFLASTLATLGATVSQMALPLTAVQLLDASATQMGILAACELLPFALLSLPAGVWVDRSRKKRLAAVFDLLGAAALALVPLAHLLGVLSLPVLYVAGFIVGCTFAVGGTAMQVFITQLVGRERLVEANSKLSAASSIAGIVGPAIAAIAVDALGAPLAITLDACGFLLSACLVMSIRRDDPPVVTEKRPMWPEVREGLQLVWRNPLLRALAVAAAVWIMLFDSFRALYVLFATRELQLGAKDLALINTLGALGALLGAAAAHRMERTQGARVTLILGYLLCGLGYGAYAVMQPGWALTALGAGLAMLVIDFGATMYSVTYISLRQQVTPDAMLGRMTATMRFISVSAAPIGSAAAGRMGDAVGLHGTLLGVAALGCLLALGAARWLPATRPESEIQFELSEQGVMK